MIYLCHKRASTKTILRKLQNILQAWKKHAQLQIEIAALPSAPRPERWDAPFQFWKIFEARKHVLCSACESGNIAKDHVIVRAIGFPVTPTSFSWALEM